MLRRTEALPLPAGPRQGLWRWNECKEMLNVRNWGYIGRLPRKAKWKFRIVESGKWEEKNEAPIVIRFCPGLAILAGHPSDDSCHGQATPNVVLQSRFKLDTVPDTCFAHPGELACPFFPLDKGFHSRAEDKL